MGIKKGGACLCGGVKISVELDKTTFGVCHCGMCRRWGGGPAMTLDHSKNVQIIGKENISIYNSSAWAQRAFCKNCGTHLYYQMKNDDYINFPLGLIDGTEDFKFTTQIFTDAKPGCYDFANKTEMMTEAEVLAKFGAPSV